MNDVVDQHLDAIRALCREFGITRLEVFGSAGTPGFDPETSDVDFLVEYPHDYDFGLWLTRYFALKARLESPLGRRVDLVMAGAIRKPRFIESVNETRRLLYAA
jgi:predicted nucleotidyltransferase